jgi:ABC-2 type transport system permease protein
VQSDPVPVTGSPPNSPGGTSSAAGGSIYDLGYQHYDGPRLGHRNAWLALYTFSLRAAFGIGRGGRAKVVPVGLVVIAFLPVVVALGVEAIVGQALRGQGIRPIRPDNYFEIIRTVLLLFCAAVAPELVGRDLRNRVLSLYFTRALERWGYAIAKLAALVSALLLMALGPQLVLIVGSALVNPDPIGELAARLDEVGPALASGLLTALLIGSISLAIAAFTPRRSFATGGIVAFFVILSALGTFITTVGSGGGLTRFGILLSPFAVMDGYTRWLFGSGMTGALRRADLPGELYGVVAIACSAVALALVFRRYATVDA